MTQANGKNGAKNPWVRLHRAALHNPKLVTLSDRQHRVWHNCMLIADDEGNLPCMRDIAVHLRMCQADAEQLLSELVEARLVDPDGRGGFRMHDWDHHQFRSDNSTERSRKCRAKKPGNADATLQQRKRDAPATPPESDTDTDSETVSLSEQEAAHATGDRAKQFVKLDLRFDRGDRGLEKLAKRAEGFELPVDELRAKTARGSRGNPAGYFRELCVEQLRKKIPAVPDRTLGEALDGNAKAFTVVCGALMQLAEAQQ